MNNIFNSLKNDFSDDIIHFGYVNDKNLYYKYLYLSDIIIMTSNHEYFGISLIESMYCYTIPLIPNKLVYCEHLNNYNKTQSNNFNFNNYLYRSNGDLTLKLKNLLETFKNGNISHIFAIFRKISKQYDANTIVKLYDKEFEMFCKT